MFRTALLTLAVGIVPGALLFRVPVLDRSRRLTLDPAEQTFWAIVLSSAWSLTVAFALAAVDGYSLERLVVIDLVVSFAIITIWRKSLLNPDPGHARPSRRSSARRRLRQAGAVLVPLALVGLAVVLYAPPAEYVIGGRDPGVYMNAGIQIAQRGGLVTEDTVVSSLPKAARPLFFPQYPGQPYFSARFMGFFLLDPSRGTVIDQFPHLYPVAIAVGYGINGLTGARYASIVAAILGVLALYFLGARLAGRTAGAVAAGLLAIHVLQVWYARYPNSETLAQALSLAALLAAARAHVDDDWFFAPIGGALLGLLPFVRFDGILVAGLATMGVFLHWLTGAQLRAAFLVPLGLGMLAFSVYLFGLLSPYAVLPGIFITYHRLEIVAGVGLALVLLAVAALLRQQTDLRQLALAWIPRLVLSVALAGAVYAWFLRKPGGSLAIHDANAFRSFGWYVPPAAIAGALLGLALLIRRRFWRDPSFFTVAIGVSFFFFYRTRIVPEHFWAARRFIVIILPAFLLTLASLTTTLPISRAGSRVVTAARHALRLVLVGLVGWSFWQATELIRPHVEFAGIIPRLEQMAARFGGDELLVFESRNASDLHVLATPLAYIYAKPVLVLNSPKPDTLLFAQFVRWARSKYRNVYFLGGGGTDLLSRDVAVVPVASERFQVPEYESLRNAYPTHVKRKEFDFGIYRFVDPAPSTGTVTLDIGDRDDLSVVRFHAKERDQRGTFRWTRAQSYLSLVSLTSDADTLVVWMENGGRPAKAPPAEVEVFFLDVSLGRVAVGPARKPYAFPIPPALAAQAAAMNDAVTVRLVSTTWNPRALIGADDDRELGVMVDRVEVRPRADARP
jgi:hypothetical protein